MVGTGRVRRRQTDPLGEPEAHLGAGSRRTSLSQVCSGRRPCLSEGGAVLVEAVPLAGALWLGVLTSISPCPLASNVAAISFVARDLTQPRRVLLSGLLYTLGRTVAYVALTGLLVLGLLSIPAVSNFLQKHLNQVLGPILIVAGVLLLDLLSVP
ncbi:MAG: hypothetical protein COY42_04660, partial [Armatimonadetes bacterium CG_4_10_14_0_8_um_filter_66_14]